MKTRKFFRKTRREQTNTSASTLASSVMKSNETQSPLSGTEKSNSKCNLNYVVITYGEKFQNYFQQIKTPGSKWQDNVTMYRKDTWCEVWLKFICFRLGFSGWFL